MMRKIVLGAAMLGLSTAAVAGPSAGDWEIVFSNAGGGLEFNSDQTSLGAGIRAGYFMSSAHEFGFGANLNYLDNDAGSAEQLDLAGFYRYNMASSESKDWFYGGVELELLNITDSDFSTEVVRPHFGKKWMLSDDVAFDINGGVIIPTESGADETFDVRFGLGIFF